MEMLDKMKLYLNSNDEIKTKYQKELPCLCLRY